MNDEITGSSEDTATDACENAVRERGASTAGGQDRGGLEPTGPARGSPYALYAPSIAPAATRQPPTRLILAVAGLILVALAVVAVVVLRGRSATPNPAANALAGPSSATPTPADAVTVTATASGPAWPTGGPVSAEPASALSSMSWRTYVDARYGFSVPVPDGMRMTTSDGETRWQWGSARLTVWGENAPKSRVAARSDLVALGAVITFERGSDSAFVLSGYLGDRIFYESVHSGLASSNWLYWEYPRAEKSPLDQPVTTSALGFAPGDLASRH